MNNPLILTITNLINPATALPVDGTLFTVPTGAEYEVVEIIEAHSVAGTDGSAVTLDVMKAASGVALASATSVLASTFDLKSTLNTPVAKNTASGLATSQATRMLRSGERLMADFTGTLTALAGLQLTIVLKRMRSATYR